MLTAAEQEMLGTPEADTGRKECRTYLALEIEEQFLSTPTRNSQVHRLTPDDAIVEALAEFPTMTDERLRRALDRFEDGEVSDDFRAGLLFAVRLVGDLDYDY